MKVYVTSLLFGGIFMNVLAASTEEDALVVAKEIHNDMGEPSLASVIEIEKEAV